MDQKITSFFVTEYKIGKWKIAPIDLLLLVFAMVFGMLLRFTVVSYTSMKFPTYIRISAGLKVASGIFDILLAILIGIYVYKLTSHKIKAYLAYAIGIMLPVLCASSAMWGMGDSIYVFFAVLALFLLSEGKGNAALVSYGISLFLNRYALFLLPLFLVAFMKKQTKAIYYLFPICGEWFRYGMVAKSGYLPFPVFEAERLITTLRGDLLLSYNWPNIYQLIGVDKFVTEYGLASKCLAVAAAFMMMTAVVMWKKDPDKGKIITAGLFLVLLFPFFLPYMDERAGLMADVLALIFAFYLPARFYIPIIQIIISYVAYSAFFRGESVMPLSLISLLSLALILHTAVLLRKECQK